MEENQVSNQSQSWQPEQPKNNAKVFVILGWIFAVLTLFFGFIPFIVALIMGIFAITRGSKTQGIWIIVVSVVLLIISLIIGGMLIAYLFSHNPGLAPSP